MNSFLANNATVVQDAVVLLGKLPESWWCAFEQRHLWFEEDGEPKPPMIKSTIRCQLQSIGKKDEPPKVDEGRMMEPVGTLLEEEEVALLSDLLEKMLKYRPEERITIQEVVRHPWFEYASLRHASSSQPLNSARIAECARMTIYCIIYNQLSPFSRLTRVANILKVNVVPEALLLRPVLLKSN
jgi:serine/threonine protein kinase